MPSIRGAPTRSRNSIDVVNRAALEWHAGSSDALLLLGHANGFCKEVWRPVVSDLRRLGVDATAVAWDARGHGSARPFSSPITWWTLATDLVDLVDDLSPAAPVVGVGHSMGGATIVMVNMMRPGLMSGMVLIEPVIVPPHFRIPAEESLALTAAMRRPTFPSREAAAASYRSKPLFRRWHEDAFSGYLDGGLVPHADGVALACRPEVESALFAASTETSLYSRLDELSAPIRLLITDYPGPLERVMDALEGRLPNTRTSFILGQSHMVVMERPDLVAAEIAAFLGDILT